MLRKFVCSLIGLGLLINISAGLAESKTIEEMQSKAASAVFGDTCLTVYNQNRALIRQQRLFNLERGINHLDWDNIPATIDVHSIILSSVNANQPIKVREQNYQYNLLEANTLLGAMVGKTVHLRRFMADGKSEEQAAVLVSSPSSDRQIFKIGERFVFNQHGQLEIDEIPTYLVSQPKLNFVLDTAMNGASDLALFYEAGGINWQCDYIVVLNESQEKFNITGLVNLDNNCGVSFSKAKLKLIAGNVQSVRPMPRMMAIYGAAEAASVSSAQVQQSSFADYHLYRFPEPVDINNKETKRLVLVERKAVPVVKEYIFDGQYFTYTPASQKIPVQIKIEFQNDDKTKQPLPAGQVKVYQEDSEHELVLVGEDNISHIPTGEKVTIKLGDAFDILGERTHVSSQQSTDHRRVDEYKVLFYNYSEKDVVVKDIEHVPDLAVFSSDATFEKLNSNTYQFAVSVPAKGAAEITYQTKNRI